MSERWRIGPTSLKTLRGMIIDRNDAWRADSEMALVIEAVIRKGTKNIDEATFGRVYEFLRYGPRDEEGICRPLDGSYTTYGFDEKQMTRAWRRYLLQHGYRKRKPKVQVAAAESPAPQP